MIVSPFRWGSFTSQKELNAKLCALAAKWIQIASARQPLALTLPLNSLGGRHAPLAARVLAYTSSLKRKTGQCRVVALLRHQEASPLLPLPAVRRPCRKHRLSSESDRYCRKVSVREM